MFGLDITLVWAILILFGVAVYVILDGFDLGVGMLYPFLPNEKDRDTLMGTIGPVWDGNETWMIFAGASLFAAFPLAYSIILTAVYMPTVLMLLALILRGVSFEYRFRATPEKRYIWDLTFTYGSIFAAFFQGVIAGHFISGFETEGTHYVGGHFSWITPFNFFAGVGLVLLYALLGSTWLIKKTDGQLQLRVRQLTQNITMIFLTVSLAIFIWTLAGNNEIAARWLSGPQFYLLIVIALLLIATSLYLFKMIRTPKMDFMPFVAALGLTALGLLGLVFTFWPYVIPYQFDIWEAAGPESSLKFSLIGAFIFLPLVIGYTIFIYYIFRGKLSSAAEEKKGASYE